MKTDNKPNYRVKFKNGRYIPQYRQKILFGLFSFWNGYVTDKLEKVHNYMYGDHMYRVAKYNVSYLTLEDAERMLEKEIANDTKERIESKTKIVKEYV